MDRWKAWMGVGGLGRRNSASPHSAALTYTSTFPAPLHTPFPRILRPAPATDHPASSANPFPSLSTTRRAACLKLELPFEEEARIRPRIPLAKAWRLLSKGRRIGHVARALKPPNSQGLITVELKTKKNTDCSHV